MAAASGWPGRRAPPRTATTSSSGDSTPSWCRRAPRRAPPTTRPRRGSRSQVSAPSVAVSSTNLFVAYALERDKQHSIERMRVPLSLPELQTGGLPDKTGKSELSDTVAVNEDKVGGDYPSMACTKDACFLVWHEVDKGGAEAALIDPQRGTAPLAKALRAARRASGRGVHRRTGPPRSRSTRRVGSASRPSRATAWARRAPSRRSPATSRGPGSPRAARAASGSCRGSTSRRDTPKRSWHVCNVGTEVRVPGHSLRGALGIVGRHPRGRGDRGGLSAEPAHDARRHRRSSRPSGRSSGARTTSAFAGPGWRSGGSSSRGVSISAPFGARSGGRCSGRCC